MKINKNIDFLGNKKLFRKSILLTLCFSMLTCTLSGRSLFASAETIEVGNKKIIGGEIPATLEEYENYLQNFSDEELQKIAEKITASEELAKQPLPRTSYKISIPGNFSIYPQETNVYCVPACVKSMLQYINGSSPSQSKIAKDLGTVDGVGTSATEIAPYLNEKQDKVYYIYKPSPSQESMCDHLYYTISEDQAPASMGIVDSSGSTWLYSTPGHSLVVNAIYSDKSIIQFADPGGGIPGVPYFYEMSAYDASQVCSRIVF